MMVSMLHTLCNSQNVTSKVTYKATMNIKSLQYYRVCVVYTKCGKKRYILDGKGKWIDLKNLLSRKTILLQLQNMSPDQQIKIF